MGNDASLMNGKMSDAEKKGQHAAAQWRWKPVNASFSERRMFKNIFKRKGRSLQAMTSVRLSKYWNSLKHLGETDIDWIIKAGSEINPNNCFWLLKSGCFWRARHVLVCDEKKSCQRQKTNLIKGVLTLFASTWHFCLLELSWKQPHWPKPAIIKGYKVQPVEGIKKAKRRSPLWWWIVMNDAHYAAPSPVC